ncbi:MAG: hypothetical protein ACP5JO_09500 [Candidatus Ratteibacteria bacterium]
MMVEKNADSIATLVIFVWLIAIPFLYIIYAIHVEKPNIFFLVLSPSFFLITKTGGHFLTDKVFQNINQTNFVMILNIFVSAVFTFLAFYFWKNSKNVLKETIFDSLKLEE